MEQISAPVRIVALVGLLGALAMGAWVMSAGMRGGTAAPDTGEIGQPSLLAPVAQANAVAGKLNAHNLKIAAGKPDTAVAVKPKPAVKVKKTVAARPVAAKPAVVPVATRTPKLLPGTPRTIAGLLGTYRVVIVLLYNPRAKVDSYSLGEAVLGATQAKAGFLRVDVLNQREAAPFMKAYGVLQDPTLLFFVRPGKLVHKLEGFADHETISQAAINAALGIGAAS